MIGSVHKLLVFVVSFGLSEVIYLKADKKFDITNKVKEKLPIQEKWKGAFCFFSILIIMTMIWMINIPYNIMSILNGALTGLGSIMLNKMSKSTNRL